MGAIANMFPYPDANYPQLGVFPPHHAMPLGHPGIPPVVVGSTEFPVGGRVSPIRERMGSPIRERMGSPVRSDRMGSPLRERVYLTPENELESIHADLDALEHYRPLDVQAMMNPGMKNPATKNPTAPPASS